MLAEVVQRMPLCYILLFYFLHQVLKAFMQQVINIYTSGYLIFLHQVHNLMFLHQVCNHNN